MACNGLISLVQAPQMVQDHFWKDTFLTIHGISVRFDMGTRPFASVLSSECVRSRPF